MQDIGAYREISVNPVGGMLGAEVSGVELRACSESAFAEIRRALADHSVICFRDQSLDALEWEAFGARFGQLSITSYVPPLAGTTYIQHFLREADFKWGDRNFGDNWHQDQTIREAPNILAGLYSVDSPRMGGDTMFASLYAAFETLSPRLQAICEDLVLVHSATGLYGPDGNGGPGVKKAISRASFTLTDDQLRDHLARETRHPLVIRHPVTGRSILYISGPYAVRFDGMTEDESAPLISYLYNHAQRPEFAMRWRWQAGQVVVWDNWACMHFGVQDYFGQRREMYRFEVEGSKPEAARTDQSAQAKVEASERV